MLTYPSLAEPLWFCLLHLCVWLLLLVPLLPTLSLYYLDYVQLKVKPTHTTFYTQEVSLSSNRDLNIPLRKVNGLHLPSPVHLVWLPHSQQTVWAVRYVSSAIGRQDNGEGPPLYQLSPTAFVE